jgi:hypothetical protein
MSENIDFVQRTVTWLENNHIFSRERKSNEQRALGMLLYYAGLSYEKAGSFVHGPKVEKLSPAATFLGSALSFQLWHMSNKRTATDFYIHARQIIKYRCFQIIRLQSFSLMPSAKRHNFFH